MNDDFVLCARAVEKNKFIVEPGPTFFLQVSQSHFPSQQQNNQRIGIATFARDLREMLNGDLDGNITQTRKLWLLQAQ